MSISGIEEEVYNLFVFLKEDVVDSLGIYSHRLSGSDSEKTVLLQQMVLKDVGMETRRIEMPNGKVTNLLPCFHLRAYTKL